MPDDVSILRQILQRELETINAYEEMLSVIKDPALRQIVEHITDEEREHVSEMYELIMERDPRQRSTADKGRQHLAAALGHEAPALVHPSAATTASGQKEATAVLLPGGAVDLAPPPALVFPESAWSVGSLKREP